ncbi:MAG: peptidase M3, partial [Prolixibacteraceae bacterium]|nr:peptidase M3 [Prolixibacteraceae bacterium]
MRKTIAILLVAGIAAFSCQDAGKNAASDNPFFTEYITPFQVPPFDEIKLGHFLPALEEGMSQQNAEIEAIVESKKEPTFENTILAYDASGELLSKVNSVFGPLNSAMASDEMQALAREISPLQTRHRDNISMNPKLFQRIKAVYEKRNNLGLDAQQMRLVEKYYSDFERNGANLSEADQAKLRELN